MPPRHQRPTSKTSSDKTLHDLFNTVAALKLHARVLEHGACAACLGKQRDSFAAVMRLADEAARYCEALSKKKPR